MSLNIDVFDHIAQHLPKEALANFSLVHSRLTLLAQPYIFQHIVFQPPLNPWAAETHNKKRIRQFLELSATKPSLNRYIKRIDFNARPTAPRWMWRDQAPEFLTQVASHGGLKSMTIRGEKREPIRGRGMRFMLFPILATLNIANLYLINIDDLPIATLHSLGSINSLVLTGVSFTETDTHVPKEDRMPFRGRLQVKSLEYKARGHAQQSPKEEMIHTFFDFSLLDHVTIILEDQTDVLVLDSVLRQQPGRLKSLELDVTHLKGELPAHLVLSSP